MTVLKTDIFGFPFRAAGKIDIGKKRRSNQDEVVLCPELGFYAVSDGMGGLEGGKLASEFVGKIMPGLMEVNAKEYKEHRDPEKAAAAFGGSVRMMSDNLFDAANTRKRISCGATFAGVWLLADKAVFCCLGDSRGYLLSKYKRQARQITEDHNIAGILVRNGELTRSQAKDHPASSRLTAFVGMEAPATPDVFIIDVKPGDRILLCSDGLYGMAEDSDLIRIMRGSRDPECVCRRLIDMANENGGRDNISAVYVRILK